MKSFSVKTTADAILYQSTKQRAKRNETVHLFRGYLTSYNLGGKYCSGKSCVGIFNYGKTANSAEFCTVHMNILQGFSIAIISNVVSWIKGLKDIGIV